MGTTVDGLAPRAYMLALQHVTHTIDADPDWRRWWLASGVPRCELGIVAENPHHHPRPGADIRKIRGRVRANFTCTTPQPARPDELVPLAVREVTGMFEVIREAIGLGRLPAVPPLAALPDPHRTIEVVHRPPPATPDEVDEGHLTLAQIQEFFTET